VVSELRFWVAQDWKKIFWRTSPANRVHLQKGESTGTPDDPELRWLKKCVLCQFELQLFFVHSRLLKFLAIFCFRIFARMDWNKLGLLLEGGYKPFSQTGVLPSELAESL
jgi:hypothetical protein